MALNIPLNGTLSYNGYSFGGAISIEASVTPKYDDADRVVTCVTHKIKVQGVIAGDPESSALTLKTTDLTMESIRRKLTKPGGPLIVTGLGLGNDISVNTGGGVLDVEFGPKPRMLGWKPIAGNAACEIDWEIETSIPMCSTTSRYTGIMALNYGVTYAFDESGDCTRTISGYLEIAMTRGGPTGIPDTADAYWEFINIAPPVGFRRTHTRSLSLDKRRLDFSITDQQIASNDAYPPSVVRIAGDHSVGIDRQTMVTYNCAISASITLAPGASGVWAWSVFHTVASQRIQHARVTHSKAVFIESIRVREGLWSRSHDFEISYRILADLKDLLTVSGLFTPLPGSTEWNAWRLSLASSMFHPRGNTRLAHNATGDALISLCEASPALSVDDQQAVPTAVSPPMISTYENEKPPPEKSYLDYKTWIEADRESPVAEQSPLQESEPEDTSNGDPHSEHFEWDVSPGSSGSEHILQKSGTRSYRYRVRGYATRVGYPVPRPRLIELGGKKAVEVHARYRPQKIAKIYGVDVYRDAWDILYALPSAPTSTIEPPGPPAAT